MKVGDVVLGKVIRIASTHLFVEIDGGYHGLLHISNVSDYYVASLATIFILEEEYEFLVIEIDDKKKQCKLSWKDIVPRFQKNPFKYKIKETASGFENLRRSAVLEENND